MNKKEITDDKELFEPLYLVTLDEIYHSRWVAAKRNRIRILRQAIQYFWPKGHPTQIIHVTGTNGKGSVIYYLEQGLRFAGNTGSWTGPHVFDYSERFHLNTHKVCHGDIIKIYREILLPYQEKFIGTHQEAPLSFAELGILLSLHLFERYNVKWGMMEVGAGGRYTPLMALQVKACLLTNVGEDHPVTLGTEIWQRALEKSGIARPGIPFFTGAEDPSLPYVQKSAAAEGAKVFTLESEEVKSIAAVTGTLPYYTLRNLALAVKVIRYYYPQYRFDPDHFTAELPARFWKVTANIIADVSHNPDKIRHLAEQLRFHYPTRRFRFIIGLTRNRDPRRVFAPIIELADHIVITNASYAGQNPHELARVLKKDFHAIQVIQDPQKAFRHEKRRLSEDQILVLTGSAYMIDQALNPNPYIRHLNGTFGRRIISDSVSNREKK